MPVYPGAQTSRLHALTRSGSTKFSLSEIDACLRQLSAAARPRPTEFTLDLAHDKRKVVPLFDTAMESNTAEAKQRHWCLTTWLILMIIANSLTALVYLIASRTIKSNLPNTPDWAMPTLAVVCIANVAFSIVLFQWKKWGFFGLVATGILTLAINLTIGLGIGRALLGVLGVGALYAVLQIGKEKRGWTQLE